MKTNRHGTRLRDGLVVAALAAALFGAFALAGGLGMVPESGVVHADPGSGPNIVSISVPDNVQSSFDGVVLLDESFTGTLTLSLFYEPDNLAPGFGGPEAPDSGFQDTGLRTTVTFNNSSSAPYSFASFSPVAGARSYRVEVEPTMVPRGLNPRSSQAKSNRAPIGSGWWSITTTTTTTSQCRTKTVTLTETITTTKAGTTVTSTTTVPVTTTATVTKTVTTKVPTTVTVTVTITKTSIRTTTTTTCPKTTTTTTHTTTTKTTTTHPTTTTCRTTTSTTTHPTTTTSTYTTTTSTTTTPTTTYTTTIPTTTVTVGSIEGSTDSQSDGFFSKLLTTIL